MRRTRVHYILFLTCIILPDVRSQVTCNWTDSIQSEGNCFLFNATEVSYAEAKASCKSIGGVLAKVETKTQMLEATKNAPNEISIWIGANDICVEGTWMWEDGGVATELYELWLTEQGQPSNKTDEDCADISKYLPEIGIWDDKCSWRIPFMCMEKVESTTPGAEASTCKTNDPATTEPTTNDRDTTEPSTNDRDTTEPTTNDRDTTEPTTNDRDTTEPTTKAILTSTSNAKCSNSGTHFIDFNVLSFFLLLMVTFLVF